MRAIVVDAPSSNPAEPIEASLNKVNPLGCRIDGDWIWVYLCSVSNQTISNQVSTHKIAQKARLRISGTVHCGLAALNLEVVPAMLPWPLTGNSPLPVMRTEGFTAQPKKRNDFLLLGSQQIPPSHASLLCPVGLL